MSKKHIQRSKGRRNQSATVILLRDKVKLVSVAFGSATIVIWLFILSCLKQQSVAIDRQLQKWKASYHLTDEQVLRLKEIELTFHGNGNPFTNFKAHTPDDTSKHHRYMSTLMNPEDGARFLADMEHRPSRH